MLSLVFAENERKILVERTLAGMGAAQAGGRVWGRPKGLTKKSKEPASLAATMYLRKKYIANQICKHYRIESKTMLYNYLRHKRIEIKGWIKIDKAKI